MLFSLCFNSYYYSFSHIEKLYIFLKPSIERKQKNKCMITCPHNYNACRGLNPVGKANYSLRVIVMTLFFIMSICYSFDFNPFSTFHCRSLAPFLPSYTVIHVFLHSPWHLWLTGGCSLIYLDGTLIISLTERDWWHVGGHPKKLWP